MTVEATLYATLSTDSALRALVDTRIYPVTLPEDCVFPAVTYRRVQTDRHMTLCGPSGGAQALMQVDALAPTFAQSRAVADAVRSAMTGIAHTFIGSDADDHDQEMDLHIVSAEFSIYYTED